jgi:hypothetical protein
MSADAVIFRIQRIVPRLTVSGERPPVAPTFDLPPIVETPGSIEDVDPSDRRPASLEELSDRLLSGRARLAQMTFYRFDPDSWR